VLDMKMPPIKRAIYLYQPVRIPDYIPGCHKAINMCWKSGVLAQVLHYKGISIGTMLASARDEKNIAQIFVWTIIIVLCSMIFERLLIRLLTIDKLNAGKIDLKEVYKELEEEDVSL